MKVRPHGTIAIGARAEATMGGGTITPWDWGGGHAYRAMLESMRKGRVKNVTFVVPPGTVWPLPLYELALLTSAYVIEDAIRDVSLTVVTVEKEPLDVFGAEASAELSALLRQRGITVVLNSEIRSMEEGLVRTSGGANAAASLRTTGPDYGRFIAALLAPTGITRASVAIMLTPNT